MCHSFCFSPFSFHMHIARIHVIHNSVLQMMSLNIYFLFFTKRNIIHPQSSLTCVEWKLICSQNVCIQYVYFCARMYTRIIKRCFVRGSIVVIKQSQFHIVFDSMRHANRILYILDVALQFQRWGLCSLKTILCDITRIMDTCEMYILH